MEQKKHYTVYQVTNLVNGKIYIGQHETFYPNDNYMGSGVLIIAAIKKYGREKFNKTILFDFDTREEMNQKEKELVNEDFISRKDTYNITVGGYAQGFRYANEHGLNNKVGQCHKSAIRCKTDENFRKQFSTKISLGIKRYYQQHTSPWLGRKHTEETKKKIGKSNSICQKGSNNSNYGKHWYINPQTNKCHPFREDDVPKGWIRGRKM